MKVPVVSRPNPNEAIVQLQKNAIIRRIEALEKKSDNIDRAKIQALKQRIKDIEKRYQEQVKKEQEELTEAYRQIEEELTSLEKYLNEKIKKNNLKTDGKEDTPESLNERFGLQLNKRV